MGTDKPRYSITVDSETLKAIDNYQFENRIRSRSEATVELIKKGIAANDDGLDENKSAKEILEALRAVVEKYEREHRG